MYRCFKTYNDAQVASYFPCATAKNRRSALAPAARGRHYGLCGVVLGASLLLRRRSRSATAAARKLSCHRRPEATSSSAVTAPSRSVSRKLHTSRARTTVRSTVIAAALAASTTAPWCGKSVLSGLRAQPAAGCERKKARSSAGERAREPAGKCRESSRTALRQLGGREARAPSASAAARTASACSSGEKGAYPLRGGQ